MPLPTETVEDVKTACQHILDAVTILHELDTLMTQKAACSLLADTVHMLHGEVIKRMAP